MRAAIYARYSSDLQSKTSIDDQVRLCRKRIEHEGWQFVEAFTDKAMSGASALRPGYQRMQNQAQLGQIDVIVAEALDRLSRDQEDIAGLFKRLAFAGVKLVTLAEGQINELHVGFKGAMNSLALKDLAAKTHRGLEGRVHQGRSAGGISYGYRVLREVDARGEPVRGGRTIDPAEAEVVRRIFEAFASGQSPRAIAKELNLDRVPGPGGRRWGDTTIRGHHLRGTGVLRNELYVGRMIWNRLRYIKDPASGKRVSRLNDSRERLVEDVLHLRIIDDGLWERVQARLVSIREAPAVSKARNTRFWEHRRPVHILTRKVACGLCGGTVTAIGRDYLGCSKARRQGTCTSVRSIRRGVLEDLILAGLRERLMAPELVKEFITTFHAETNRLAGEAGQARVRQERELAEVQKKLAGLIDAIADGIRAPGLQQKLDELEARRSALARELDGPPPSPVRLHPNLAELYRQKVAALHQALADPETRTEALTAVRSLIERVVLTPAGRGFEIELEGEIAAMVRAAIPSQSKTAAPVGAAAAAFDRSVKVVAGTRNQRHLQ